MEANGNASNILHDANKNYENLNGHLGNLQFFLDGSIIKTIMHRVKNLIFKSRDTSNNKLLKRLDKQKFTKILK